MATKQSVKRFLLLPIAFAARCIRWAIGKVWKSEKDRQAEDKAHQAAVRRELRGLPPEHDPNPKM